MTILMKMAERAGFEPAVPFRGTQHFQCCTFGRSVTSPKKDGRVKNEKLNSIKLEPKSIEPELF